MVHYAEKTHILLKQNSYATFFLPFYYVHYSWTTKKKKKVNETDKSKKNEWILKLLVVPASKLNSCIKKNLNFAWYKASYLKKKKTYTNTVGSDIKFFYK